MTQRNSSLRDSFGVTTPLEIGTEEWDEDWCGNVVQRGMGKTECQDRAVVCPDILVKSKQTKQQLEELIGELPERAGLFAVFDGHGGNGCSSFLAANLVRQFWRSVANVLEEGKKKEAQAVLKATLIDTCLELEKTFIAKFNRAGRRDGSCGNICLVWGESFVICANVGDSRAMVSDDGALIKLSQDHKPDNETEKARIEKVGGSVATDRRSGESRMQPGNIAISRAFGNVPIKERSDSALIAKPDIEILDISNTTDLLLLASDGIWCRLSSEEALEIAKAVVDKTGNCHEACMAVGKESATRKTNDDCAVIAVLLHSS